MGEVLSTPGNEPQLNNLESAMHKLADLLRDDGLNDREGAEKIDKVMALLADKGVFNKEIPDEAINHIRFEILDYTDAQNAEQIAESIEEYLK